MSVNAGYISGRKQFARPQALIWADAAPTIASNGKLVPVGYEKGINTEGISGISSADRFIILSDHNRESLSVSTERIEQRQRMANGTMRSYHIADKLNISISWSMLPSRSSAVPLTFDENGKPSDLITETDHDENPATPEKTVTPYGSAYYKDQQYTADGGAGGGEMLDWYETHTGPFWVLLSYDKYNEFGSDADAREHLNEYSQALQMYISDFNYSIVKRGATNFDMWDISVTLEEV
jgi:hypothetical protein